jgi:hypothetical protein
MITVELTAHLYRYFAQLESRTIRVPSGSVAQILSAINDMAPGFTDYVLDDHGALRRHVNVSINDSILIDRKTLSDRVQDGSTLYIFQALSGG